MWTVFTKQVYTDTTGMLLAICSSKEKAEAYVKKEFPNAKKEKNSSYYCNENDLIIIDQEEIDIVL